MNKWTVVLNDTFSVDLTTPMILENTHRYSVALVRGEFNYSWYNISTTLGNNTFKYSTDGITYITEIIPDGVWCSCELILYIETIINAITPIVVPTVPPVPNIVIKELFYNAHWKITTENGFYFDTGTLGPIIGFALNLIINPATPTMGTSITKFMDEVKSINISCNIVDNTKNHHNKGNANILFSAGTPLVLPWGRIILVDTVPIKIAAGRSSNINRVSINILDHNLKPITLTDQSMSFWIEVTDEGRIPEASKPVAST